LCQQRIRTRPEMQHIIKMLPEIGRILGIEALKDIDKTDA
jgi:hypothetical protein